MSVVKKLFSFTKKRDKKNRYSSLEENIDYVFQDRKILEHALSHRSYSFTVLNDKNKSNERLEFLGDALLGFVVSDFLYEKYDGKAEGELSRIKSLIISRKALKEAADKINLGQFLLLSKSEEKTGGRKRFSINTNAIEALIAAIYLDGGFDSAKKFVKDHILSLLPVLLKDKEFKNYKSKLLEMVQAKDSDSPKYMVTDEVGPDHNKIFSISVAFWGKEYGSGEGKSKKEAEQVAARNAIDKILHEGSNKVSKAIQK